MNRIDYSAYDHLDFEAFASRAQNPDLSKYEKIGFPDSYREGFEAAIFKDIRGKLPVLDAADKTILDIGPGCSDLPALITDHCEKQGHQLVLVDSQPMLDLLPQRPHVRRVAGYFPTVALDDLVGSVDGMICYSVFQYIHADGQGSAFLEAASRLLAAGGRLLLGDLPNVDMRKRFFRSARGIAFHKAYMNTDQPPDVSGPVPPGSVDDGVVLQLLHEARGLGLHAYVQPQDPSLPMANRREDMVIEKP